jgi:predicted permease
MPDWKEHVRRNLHLSDISAEREAEIVDDLAGQLADAYLDALSRGLDELNACQFAKSQIGDWKALACSLEQSRKNRLDLLDRLEHRKRFGWIPMRHDILFALRMIRKSPLFTTVIVLTLALGIGANTAIFSVVNSMLLQARPAQNPNELVSLRWNANAKPKISHSSYGDCQTDWSGNGASSCSFSLPFFRELQHSPVSQFAGLAGFAGAPRLDLVLNGSGSIVNGQLVSGDYFSTLGVRAAAGRLISPSDDTEQSSGVVVLSYDYWRKAFNSDPSAIGTAVRINSAEFTIIGVAEQRFTNLAVSNPIDVWMPLSANPQVVSDYDPRQADADSWWIEVVARLRDKDARTVAEKEVGQRFHNEVVYGSKPALKETDQPSAKLIPVWRALGPSSDKVTPVYVLSAAVGLVLLIACVNVAGLLLARATARRKEIAVRFAVGAARGHILRQLLTESLLLSLLGGLCGVLFSFWALHVLVEMISNGGSRAIPFTPTIDTRVMIFTITVSLLTGIFFGLVPAMAAAHMDLNSTMKDIGNGARDKWRRQFTFRNGLACVQVGLAIILLVGAGLFVRTLENLLQVNPGFDTHNMLIFGVDGQLAGYKDAQVDDLYRDLRQRLSAIPGVSQVSYSWRPLLRGSLWTRDIHLPGTAPDAYAGMDYLPVGPDFFSTMGVRLLSGRDFQDSDFATARSISLEVVQHPHDAPPVQPMPAIVNETFVQQYAKGQEIVGQQFGYENGPDQVHKRIGYEVIGVVRDAKYSDLRREVKPTMYTPTALNGAFFEVRTTSLKPESLLPAVRNTISTVDKSLPLFDIKTQAQQIDEQLVTERTLAKLFGFFAVLALLLASIGIYGLLSFEVAQHTREVGVRMALGARRSDVLAGVVRRGLLLAAIGALGGIPLAVLFVRLLSSLLYGVNPLDPMTLAGVVGLLFAVVTLACIVPARRAATVDPVISIRCE